VLAVAAQNNNTIVVVHSVGPLIVEPWIDHPNVTAVGFFLLFFFSTSNYIVPGRLGWSARPGIWQLPRGYIVRRLEPVWALAVHDRKENQ